MSKTRCLSAAALIAASWTGTAVAGGVVGSVQTAIVPEPATLVLLSLSGLLLLRRRRRR